MPRAGTGMAEETKVSGQSVHEIFVPKREKADSHAGRRLLLIEEMCDLCF